MPDRIDPVLSILLDAHAAQSLDALPALAAKVCAAALDWSAMTPAEAWEHAKAMPKLVGPWMCHQRVDVTGRCLATIMTDATYEGVERWRFWSVADYRRDPTAPFASRADAMRAADATLVEAGYRLVGAAPAEPTHA